MRPRKLILLLALCTALLAAATACGGGDDDESSGTTTTTDETAAMAERQRVRPPTSRVTLDRLLGEHALLAIVRDRTEGLLGQRRTSRRSAAALDREQRRPSPTRSARSTATRPRDASSSTAS